MRAAGAVLGAVFFLCYAYQFFYLIVPLLPVYRRRRRREREEIPPDTGALRFAVLIAARNEAAVIGQLLDSLTAQDYRGALTACVVADNCTDDTATVARARGAWVCERFDRRQVGKGYALDFLLRQLDEAMPDAFDAYLILDADNLLEPDYVTQIDRAMRRDGYAVVTGYRASKNFGDSWVSAGNALCFLRECQQLDRARAALGVSCTVSGTGFAVSRAVIERLGGWPFHCLTEDAEFSARMIAAGETIGYCADAVLYDEQPVRFSLSCRQRLRWIRGYFQVLRSCGWPLVCGAARGSFSCFDLLCSIFPAFAVSLLTLAINAAELIVRLVSGASLLPPVAALGTGLLGLYATVLLLGAAVLLSEWRRIAAPAGKKLMSLLTFPVFMLSYIPLAVIALFCRVEWRPIAHTRALTLDTVGRVRK